MRNEAETQEFSSSALLFDLRALKKANGSNQSVLVAVLLF